MSARGLRIGLVGPLPLPSGGMANQTRQLARLLRESGAEVEVIRVNRPYLPGWVGRLRGLRAAFRFLPYILHLWRAAGRVDLFHVMANSGWSWHLFAAPAIWVAKLNGTPVIVNYRGGEADVFFNKSLGWVSPSMERADAIIVPSRFLESVFARRGWQSHIVPNIIDMDRFAMECASRSGKEAPCILVARNLEAIYDNATALRAFQIVRRTYARARMIVAGAGPERTMLELLANELGVATAVTFTGRVDNDDMARLYHQADLMVNPSLADNMPISILESLACGTPVVSTNVGGIPSLVEHDKTAILVPPQQPAEMAAAILDLLADEVKRKRLRDDGVEFVRQFTWEKVSVRLLEVYRGVLRGDGQLAVKRKANGVAERI